MSKANELNITLISVKSFTCKQSEHGVVPSLPLRGVMSTPSGSGETVVLHNLILNVYRECFENIFAFSQSINVNQTWEAVKKYH
jgi:hypothetical protein